MHDKRYHSFNVDAYLCVCSGRSVDSGSVTLLEDIRRFMCVSYQHAWVKMGLQGLSHAWST